MQTTPETPPIASDALDATPVAPPATPEPAPHPTAPDVNPSGMDPLPPELSPPDSIAAYKFPPPEDSPGGFAADVEARSWMLAAGLPAPIGSFIATEIGRMEDPTGGDDVAFELARLSLMSQMERMYGDEATAKKLADVQWLVEHVDRKSGGRLGDWLEENAGVLLNLQVLGQLAAHAERMRGRLR